MKFSKNKKIAIIASVLILLITAVVLWKVRSPAQSPAPSAQGLKAEKKPLYTCPMHPGITSDHPDNCPICHMALQRVDEEGEEEAEKGHETPSPLVTPGADQSPVPGRASFALSREKQQLIGVTTAHVERRVLGSEIRATGRVAFDPELYTAIEEYRQALIASSQMASSSYEGLKEQSNELVTSSRTKLKLMGLSDQQIKTFSTKSSSLSLILPKGFVWIYAEIFEYEMAAVKMGQEVEANAPSIPGRVFVGKVSSVSPILNAPTRTVRVRAEVPDPDGLLRPDTFVNVKIRIDLGKQLAVPEDAVLHSGDQAFVFVAKEKGKLEPRAVTLGRRVSEYYEILSGLEEGEVVVTAANFLIDSESRLRNALQDMGGSGGSHSVHAPTKPKEEKSAPSGHVH